ncbi:MAG TPA: hypothetical protein VHE32_00635 [Rhodanobacteraceae bacterium]|nr:hypothetical protein [Rhodanobacteraceae bacterium]
MHAIDEGKSAFVQDFAGRRLWYSAGLGFSLLMLGVHAVAGFHSAGVADSWRDIYWATRIARGEAFPLTGPPIYGLFELGPWWFYVLALPIAATGRAAAAAVFVQLLAGLKYFLAWRLGLRIADERLGLAFAASLALAGWSTIPMMFPSHTALVETTVLLLAMAAWRCRDDLSRGRAFVFGLAAAASIHAHPTTATYVGIAGLALLARHRSWRALGLLALSACVVALSLLPPWLDPTPTGIEKTIGGYIGTDIGVHAARRIPALIAATIANGPWTGFLLMTSWGGSLARAAWLVYIACLLVAVAGLFRVRSMPQRVRIAAAIGGVLFVAQVVLLVFARPITPMWMLSGVLPPLALALAAGWYGALTVPSTVRRSLVTILLGVFAVLSLAPFGLFTHDLDRMRNAADANPFQDVTGWSKRYVEGAVPHYPVHRVDRLAREFCGEEVVHGRLAVVLEQSLGSPTRLACGHWPTLRYGGREGRGPHVAGLLVPASIASGIAPDRVVSRMALYGNVTPIAPSSGGRATHLARDQINPDTTKGGYGFFDIAFDAPGSSAVVLTSRFPNAMPLNVKSVRAGLQEAVKAYDDGGSRVYRCGGCVPGETVHWRFDLEGNEEMIDLVVIDAGSRSAMGDAAPRG